MSKSLSNLVWVTIGYDKNRVSGISVNAIGLIAMGNTLEYVLEQSKDEKFKNYNIEAFEISDSGKFADECVTWLMRVSGVKDAEVAKSITVLIGYRIVQHLLSLSPEDFEDDDNGAKTS